eukprot:CAMPEP_0181215298 /NCGR_PEP_ID=MMETSP1096-20121128/25936_1 /TAXON_ID=156174 ORGANISM="Chrysochromulina ericina, Strain CCMP281" /NCGR_SAMPLE_ID=MMETSP1096 /ASSEMBLY_ACC=CAM_ASM_000453 /LENGTH=197 /DNA_ID=CAMNT_0023307139 /DNA_START=1 /DNA_END=594 /DNA_ORIENTATION=+
MHSCCCVLVQMQPGPRAIARCASPIMNRNSWSDDERNTLRLPEPQEDPDPGLDDTGDPFGMGSSEAFFERARLRVKRRAKSPNNLKLSDSLPLPALVGQLALNGCLCGFLLYSFLVCSEADAGLPWALESLTHSDEWLFGAVHASFGDQPPSGWLALLSAGLNGLNVLRCAPLLFDRLVIKQAPNMTPGQADGAAPP